jgi:hypothetical protein
MVENYSFRGYENASTEGGSSTDITPYGGGTI